MKWYTNEKDCCIPYCHMANQWIDNQRQIEEVDKSREQKLIFLAKTSVTGFDTKASVDW